jgi:hypothetical protein
VTARSTPRRTAWPAVGLALAASVAGCGSSSHGMADPSSPSTHTSSSSPSPSRTAPANPPATGPKVALTAFSVRAPGGYRLDHSFGKEIVFASDPHLLQELTFSDTSIFPGTSNAAAAHLSIENNDWSRKPRTAAPVTLQGRRFYHLTGPVGQGKYVDEYGSVQGARVVTLTFETVLSRAARQRLVGSVLETLRLK